MKKVAIFLFSAALMVMGADVLSAQGKYGADSAECIKYLSYYQEYFKQKNYDEAIPHWRKAFKLCPPTANQTMLINGAVMYRNLIKENFQNDVYRDALIDTLVTIDETRAVNYPKYAVTAYNNLGLDMINYVKNDNKRLYEGLSRIVEINKDKTVPNIFLFQFNAAIALYEAGQLGTEDILNVYDQSMGYLEGLVAANPSNETYSKISSAIEDLFITSNVASCDALIELFTPRLAASPDDLALASNIVRMLSTAEECTDNDLFVQAATTMHRLDPSHKSAYFLYRIYSLRGDVDNAEKMMQEAIDAEDSDSEQDAEYYFELATFCYKNSRSVDSYNYVLKCIDADTDKNLNAKCYMLAGTIWGSTVCKGNEIEVRAPYWVAVDYMNRAKAADPSLAEECNNYISQYRTYYPTTGDAFMYDLTDGQSYTVSCNGMTATTTVRTQQ